MMTPKGRTYSSNAETAPTWKKTKGHTQEVASETSVVGVVPLRHRPTVTIVDQRQKVVDVNKYLNLHLSNVTTQCDMVLQEREAQLWSLLTLAGTAGCGSSVRRVVFSCSPRGSGKTQMVKYFLSTRRANAVKWGRVIVRCCDKAAHETWAVLVKSEMKTDPNAANNDFDAVSRTAQGLCELIRMHVEAVTGGNKTCRTTSIPGLRTRLG
ncbi:Bodo-specific multi-copy gene family, putative [Bodo saltans]|uniref:Bodo-specific multi-copy gene family, putative n=1 Tax=Bodo saltans TaxID=75058 RepID=A0A0S4JRU0_BODSA|nr:Bodo-specific multi-copy gene family, putative [Bodo saltans]|eukprot:CUG92977.1 Bodo-specific multi-copy gene family, putative [Bodo saltans]